MAEREIVWARRALETKMAILEYWFQETGNTDYPLKLENLFSATVKMLTKHPQIGPILNEKRNIRYVVVRDYKVYYTFDDQSLIVLLIWDTRRDHKTFTI